MIQIFEVHEQLDDKNNLQSRVIEYESFEKYVHDMKNDKASYQGQLSIPRQSFYTEELRYGDRWLECIYVLPILKAKYIHKAYIIDFPLYNSKSL